MKQPLRKWEETEQDRIVAKHFYDKGIIARIYNEHL